MVKLIEFLFNIKAAYRLYIKTENRNDILDSIRVKFNSYGFDDGRYDGAKDVSGDPLRDAGTAIRLIKRYNLDLHIGMSYGDCRCVLEKTNWQNPLNKDIDSYDYGTFTLINPDDVESIYAFGFTVQEAVAKCLINARIAGVI